LASRMVGSPQYERPSRQLKRIFGPAHADLFEMLDRFNRERTNSSGIDAMRKMLPLRQAQFRDDDVRSAVIAECLCSAGNAIADRNGVNRNTLAMLTEAERIARAGSYLHPRKRAWIYWNLGRNLEPRREYAEAERQARDALSILEGDYGGSDPL